MIERRQPNRIDAKQRDPLRVALVGAGRWGKKLLRVFSEAPRAHVVAVCDQDPDVQSYLAENRPDLDLYSNLDRLLERTRSDAIVIATPSDTHALLGLCALDAGKHLFIEKPMATSLASALALYARAQAAGKKVMVGHVLEYHPNVVRLCDAVASGSLGELRFVCSERFGIAAANPADPWWELAPHDFSLLRLVTRQEPELITARRRADGGIGAAITLANGIRARIAVGRMESEQRTRCTLVVGSEGVAVFDEMARGGHLALFHLQPGLSDWMRTFASWWRDTNLEATLGPSAISSLRRFVPSSSHESPDEPLRLEAAHFIAGVLDAAEIKSDANDGLRVVMALDAGERSAKRDGLSMHVPKERQQSRFAETRSLSMVEL
jgi:predicted dehydrogenase